MIIRINNRRAAIEEQVGTIDSVLLWIRNHFEGPGYGPNLMINNILRNRVEIEEGVIDIDIRGIANNLFRERLMAFLAYFTQDNQIAFINFGDTWRINLRANRTWHDLYTYLNNHIVIFNVNEGLRQDILAGNRVNEDFDRPRPAVEGRIGGIIDLQEPNGAVNGE